MDTLRGPFDAADSNDDEHDFEDYENEPARQLPPEAIGQDERRMQVRAYNHWAGQLDDCNFPSIDHLEPEKLDDFGPFSVLLHFATGVENPAIKYLGASLAEECGASADIGQLNDVPSRSLLSRITDHYMQILANQAPIGFEAEFVNQRGATILYRGILLPYSSDGETIDYIYGVINWKEMADQATTDELLLEIDQALEQVGDGNGPEGIDEGWGDDQPLPDLDLDLDLERSIAEEPLRESDVVTEWADMPLDASDDAASDDDAGSVDDEDGETDESAFPQPAFGAELAYDDGDDEYGYDDETEVPYDSEAAPLSSLGLTPAAFSTKGPRPAKKPILGGDIRPEEYEAETPAQFDVPADFEPPRFEPMAPEPVDDAEASQETEPVWEEASEQLGPVEDIVEPESLEDDQEQVDDSAEPIGLASEPEPIEDTSEEPPLEAIELPADEPVGEETVVNVPAQLDTPAEPASVDTDQPQIDEDLPQYTQLEPAEDGEVPTGLYDCLAEARELADAARNSEDRSRKALYSAVGRAYDVSLAAQDAPEDFAELLDENGLTVQDRAPMTPVVKLVFGADYDKTRLTEYATVLTHAHRAGIARGELAGFLRQAEGGLKGVVATERRIRREEAGERTDPVGQIRAKLAESLRALETHSFDTLDPEGPEFGVVVIRRMPDGQIVLVGEVADDIPLVERAARKLVA